MEPGRCARGERRLGLFDEPAPVDEARQRVVERLVAELDLQGAALVDVPLQQADQAGQAGEDEERQEGRRAGHDRQTAGGVGADRDEQRAGDHRERRGRPSGRARAT